MSSHELVYVHMATLNVCVCPFTLHACLKTSVERQRNVRQRGKGQSSAQASIYFWSFCIMWQISYIKMMLWMINPCREVAILWFTFCVAGTTWTTAFALMCLWDLKLRPSPVPAFTSLHECYRYKTVLCPSSPLLGFTQRCGGGVNVRLFPSFFQISLPSRPLWYQLFGATEEEIKDICTTTLKLYTRKRLDLF